MKNRFPDGMKVYWLRENVLKPIFLDLVKKYNQVYHIYINKETDFNIKTMKRLLDIYGVSNKQIGKSINVFVSPDGRLNKYKALDYPEFYAYYADYDWVAFAQLYGKMMNLPEGYPMYCVDLKQLFDQTAKSAYFNTNPEIAKKNLKSSVLYPKQINEHSALDDAKWNKKLYTFLNKFTKHEI